MFTNLPIYISQSTQDYILSELNKAHPDWTDSKVIQVMIVNFEVTVVVTNGEESGMFILKLGETIDDRNECDCDTNNFDCDSNVIDVDVVSDNDIGAVK